MDRARNPYTPNAGAPPRYFAGRAAEVEDFRILLKRLAAGYTEQSVVVTGLRGVGKTVLLGEYRRIADEESWVAVDAEVSKNTDFGPQMANLARRALLQVSPRARWGDRAKAAAAAVKSFSLTVQPDGSLAGGLDVERAWGKADTGILNEDLADVFEAVGEAAREKDSGVVFLFDEIQFLHKTALEALIGAVHRTVQRRLPVTFAGAGLPQLPGLAGEAKSYAERLFKFPLIGELPEPAARDALVRPARAEGVDYEPAAVDEIIRYTEGYPYFLQEYGRAAWNIAEGPTITASDVALAGEVVDAELDESFFRARAQRSSPEELRYMRAMAELGADAQKAGDVATVLGKASEQVAPIRARLINKGLLFTPRHGYAKFTVPQFDRFMKRYMELDSVPPA
ncbi:ATPase [Xylanimonas cellulosilytica DSM 15894]|uniref:ATPase n=1 Tax=Xylanimonas cellulosilytica (strain DSM 15894 / JCM 12276 / CECT 5975 / KCTC 9989 / LMG 20990 / NBRC 107835 / XIL07) TaxID=446471 RepID=D1BTD0_XYLCX|nr:ATP-binding protein [Xylanimonas cellulosilytica]ACZ29072.1 ATPase [Xylanimonas cellulosilytica DSM 15894]